jgi:hypothetical protein
MYASILRGLSAPASPATTPIAADPDDRDRMRAHPNRKLRRAGGLATAALIVAAALVPLGVAAPASAHARCDGVSHSDWHTIAFHYDRHAFSRYEYSNHYHWWNGSNHTHTHVRFRNTTHGYDYFTANC